MIDKWYILKMLNLRYSIGMVVMKNIDNYILIYVYVNVGKWF